MYTKNDLLSLWKDDEDFRAKRKEEWPLIETKYLDYSKKEYNAVKNYFFSGAYEMAHGFRTLFECAPVETHEDWLLFSNSSNVMSGGNRMAFFSFHQLFLYVDKIDDTPFLIKKVDMWHQMLKERVLVEGDDRVNPNTTCYYYFLRCMKVGHSSLTAVLVDLIDVFISSLDFFSDQSDRKRIDIDCFFEINNNMLNDVSVPEDRKALAQLLLEKEHDIRVGWNKNG